MAWWRRVISVGTFPSVLGGALLQPGQADLRLDIDHDRHIRHDVADGEAVDLVHRIAGEIARDALVHGRRVEEPVAEHDCAADEGGGDDLAHELGAGGGEEEELGFRAHLVALGIVDDDIANLLADFRPARFASREHLAARLLHVRSKPGDLVLFGADTPAIVHDVLGHERCGVVGGDVGGATAVDLLHRYPELRRRVSCDIEFHGHNDTGCAVANTLAAVDAGATHVQGTLNGYGERTGNADLVSVVANLELKLGRQVLPPGHLREATRIAHAVAEVTNFPPASRQPYVGVSAFAHKAGLHASAIKVDPNLYQHMDPMLVGNDMRLLVSDMAGRASIELKGRELGFDLSDDAELVSRVTRRVKELESSGYTFEAADASFELLLLEEVEGVRPSYFSVESWRVITDSKPGDEAVSEATIKLHAGGARILATGEWAQARFQGRSVEAPADLIVSRNDLLEPLLLCYRSLKDVGLPHIANGPVMDTIRRIHAHDLLQRIFFPRPRLLWLENTHNTAGGTVRHTVTLRFEGVTSNRSAIGARVTVSMLADTIGRFSMIRRDSRHERSMAAGSRRRTMLRCGARMKSSNVHPCARAVIREALCAEMAGNPSAARVVMPPCYA